MFNVYKNQLSRQTESRNLTDPKTLPTIWYTYMTLVTKYQISAINSYWEICDEIYLGRMEGRTDGRTERRTDGRKGGPTDRGKTVYPPPLSGSGGIIKISVFKKRYLYTEYRYIICMHFTRYIFNLNSDIFITTRTPSHINFVNIFLSEFVGVDSF